MGKIVNLRQRRKEKVRTVKDKRAEANRLQFGRSKKERNLSRAKAELEEKRLDGARLEAGKPGGARSDSLMRPSKPARDKQDGGR